ncbi:MAG: carbamoyltransferase C-terminal domain-containing protein [Candidatus Promineifilaceae bacterium]
MKIIGVFHGIDPAACLFVDGELVAYVEEERLIRFKHAAGQFPIRSIAYCCESQGIDISEVDYLAYGWDCEAYTDGRLAQFYEQVNAQYPPDSGTLGWQRSNLSHFNMDRQRELFRSQLVRFFGDVELPPLKTIPHHYSHAITAYHMSELDDSLVLTIDGSGDSQTTCVWRGQGDNLDMLHEIKIPHSLGWFYAAMTEYLGFKAYDGEYKVMGLAAFGRPNLQYRKALEQIVTVADDGFSFCINPKAIHHGNHTFSYRHTDYLVELFGLEPRLGNIPIDARHEDLAYETQRMLEVTVLRLLSHFQEETGIRNLCISGGVGLNVKMNSAIHKSSLFDKILPFPIPSDSGTGIGAAAALHYELTGERVKPLKHVYLGPGYTDDEIELQIKSCGLSYERCDDIAEATADLLAAGKVVGWFQGRLEGGPRALGSRSILADSRTVEARDRVNQAIKFREYWRPFCPSLAVESKDRFMKQADEAPYMIMAFDATEESAEKAKAVVHIDGTMRVQTVNPEHNPVYHRLLKAFEQRAGIPIVLNTSFNIKGEAIVCSPRDALRTFWTTGLDALAIGPFLIEKPCQPTPIAPEDVIR